jgi:hypothetical protein
MERALMLCGYKCRMKICEVHRFLLTLKVRIMMLSPDTVSIFPKKGFSDPPVS